MTPVPSLARALSGKRLLIFDFDGTIADTNPLHAQAFADTLSPFNISVCYSQIAGMRTVDALISCFQHAGVAMPDREILQSLTAEKQRRVRELITTSLQPNFLIDAFLVWAKSHYPLALVTSGSRATVTMALIKLGYQSLFQTQIFSEDVNYAKPDPEGFLLALSRHNCHPSQALVFEDSQAGFQAAMAAEVSVVNVLDPQYGLTNI